VLAAVDAWHTHRRFFPRAFCPALFVIVFFLFFSGACAHTTGQLRSSRTPEALFSSLQEELARAAARPGFAFQASLAYRDQRQDLHFLLDAWHDKARRFTRLTITGALDAALWAELIALGDDVRLSLPLEDRVITGKRGSLHLQSAEGIRIQIGELLSLVELEPAVDTNRRIRGASGRAQSDILFLEEDQYNWSAIEFSPQGAIMSIRDISAGRERAHILYEHRDGGIARKQTIISAVFDSRITLWLSSFDWYTPTDNAPAGTHDMPPDTPADTPPADL